MKGNNKEERKEINEAVSFLPLSRSASPTPKVKEETSSPVSLNKND
jgi:hypothetical protein